MSPPIAYHLTWTTYGTWLPGDGRGWVSDIAPGIRPADPRRQEFAAGALADDTVTLTPEQRAIVDATIRRHCEVRGWELHAVNVRTNHVHVVVTADRPPDDVVEQFKAWGSRKLSEALGRKRKWWTEGGSTKWINDEAYFAEAVDYVLDRQSPARRASEG